MVQSQQQEKVNKRQLVEACARALLVCESEQNAATSLERHPLAASLAHGGTNPQTLLRGWNDSNAFLHAYHDKKLHDKLIPDDGFRAMLFDVMEYERCISVGADHYRGAAQNILQFKQLPRDKTQTTDPQYQLLDQMSLLTRDALAQSSAKTVITQHPALQRLSSTFVQVQEALRTSKNDQRAFAQLALSVLALLDPEYDQLEPQQQTESLEQTASLQSEGEMTTGEAKAEGESSEGVTEDLEQAPSLVMQNDSVDGPQPDELHALDDAASVSSSSADTAIPLQTGSGYQAYSTTLDEVVDAADLALVDDIETYREQLDAFIQRHGSIVNRLSARLRQLLLAQQLRCWQFDLEEGTLDTSRLCRVVTSPSQPLSFKAEQDSLFKDTAVCLLIDNSKSMVGKPIATAAACADILAQTLERCGVSVEVLGFTTTALHASELLEQWQTEGAQIAPGRMNGLRHIIYKNAAAPYRRVRTNLGAMLDRQLLKQNIDGEALLWAYNRLRVQAQKRKLLMVISDGAPLDASTLTANSKDYLVAHLHQCIAQIERDRQIELCAIGINHDVSHYYKNAITIHDARHLGKALMQQLGELFTSK